jgi:hypothetical protein
MPDLFEAISVEISEDETVATLRVASGVKVSDCDREAVLAYLAEQQIQLQPDSRDAIDSLLAAIREKPGEAHSVVVARGKPPEHGRMGRLQWEDAFDPEKAAERGEKPGDDDHGACHYTRSAFTMVKAGDHLATLMKPTDGVDGYTVRGKTIAARDGKPAQIKFDRSVIVRDGGQVVAGEAGALSWRSGELKIISHLEIDDFVDFSTGNIEFDGDVTVHRGVRDCFVVSAAKDLRIRGMVEAADVIAGRDARLEGGVAARDKGRVYVERDLFARYIDSAAVVVGRHASVEKEIVNADLSIGGALSAPSGAIIGGETTVGGAIELAEIGSSAGSSTLVTLGAMRDFDELKGKLGSLATLADEMHRKAKEQYDMLTANASKLTASQAEQMTELQFSLATLDAIRGKMSQADEKIATVVAKHTDIELTVHRLIHAGVRVRIGGFEAKFKDPIKGPVRITLGASGRPVLTDLVTESARDLSQITPVHAIDDNAAPGGRAA